MYITLEVHKTATSEEIRQAYRKLAFEYHPAMQKTPNFERDIKYREVNEANELLKDERRRAFYDRYGSLGLYLARMYGEENVKLYFILKSTWTRVILIFLCPLTLFCCCCMCCCYCGFCCKKWKPKRRITGQPSTSIQLL